MKIIDPLVLKYKAGVVVGRFQVPELHEAHKQLIAAAKLSHEKYMIFIACTSVKGSLKDPLDFDTRANMIRYQFPDAIIRRINDNPSDEIWSQELDGLIIAEVGKKKVILYSGNNGFADNYTGRFPIREIPEIDFYRGTEIREIEGKVVPITKEGRCGVIYGVANQYPRAYPTVDVAVIKDNSVLLGIKKNMLGLRFPGGFVDPTDKSLEDACKREVQEECGGIEIADFEYICSGLVDDWRYRGRDEKIISSFFLCKYIFGNYIHACTQADAEFTSLKFYPINSDTLNKMAPTHRQFFKSLLNPTNDEKIVNIFDGDVLKKEKTNG